MTQNLSYKDVEDYLRHFGTDPQQGPYDFNGLIHLMLAILDNFRENGIEGDFEHICYSMTDPQRQFLKLLADYGCRLDDAAIEREDD